MILPRRLLVAPILMLVLSAGPLSAATTSGHRPPEAGLSRVGSTGTLSEAWNLLSRLWRNAGRSADFFEKAGSSTDPFGNPAPTAVQAHPVATPPQGHPGGTT
jgi:hypothetical protein